MKAYGSKSSRHKAATSSGNAWTYTKKVKDGMDVADIKNSAAPSSFGQLPRKGGEFHSYFRRVEQKRRLRRALNKAERRDNRPNLDKEE